MSCINKAVVCLLGPAVLSSTRKPDNPYMAFVGTSEGHKHRMNLCSPTDKRAVTLISKRVRQVCEGVFENAFECM